MIYVTLIICFVTSLLVTPLIKKLALKIGAVDKPNQRKVHSKVMPRLGGLAIFISMLVGCFFLQVDTNLVAPILIGAAIIVIVGVLDDTFELSPRWKLVGQLLAAAVIIFYGDIQINFFNLPFDYMLELGVLSIPFTFLWIVGITNAINLIDGLDGLAAGVSSIVLITISGIAFSMGYFFVFTMAMILLGSTLGFLVYNFHPAKIFMGDTGALLLGFMIAVLSMLGFKNVTFISFIVPIIILGVPISDTLFAIIRRLINKKPLSAPDKSHLHHCLLGLGYSHRQVVLVIYGMSALFGLMAVLYTRTNAVTSIILLCVLGLGMELIVERIGLVNKNYRPILNFVNGLKYSSSKNKP
ncbi:MAG: glycosyltransferase family 4 protein [Bacillaceae bacterium]